MPSDRRGQLITFAIERDTDQAIARWTWVDVRVGDTVAKIAARRGHPEDAARIRDQNSLRSARQVLRHSPKRKHDRTRLQVPGELKGTLSFDVLAGDRPPVIEGGYAKLSIIDRPQRTGLTRFDGYDPIQMPVPIRFESTDRSGLEIERDIALLERMAGRGNFEGASVGPPPIIRVSCTGPSGEVVPLIPANYQWTPLNPTGPLWQIAGIAWDADSELRNGGGNRIRAKAVVSLQQWTRLSLLSRSVTQRAKTKPTRLRDNGLQGLRANT